MKHKVLITAPYMQLELDDYRSVFERHDVEIVVPPVNERMEEEQLLPLVGDIDGIVCGDDRITGRVLDAAPKLKVIVKWGTGTDSIDKAAASKRGIPVRNTPNAFTQPVADTILSFMLCFARGTIDLHEKMRGGIWEKKLYRALNECTVGVIGVGNIGSAVIQRAQAFGARILANDIKEMQHDYMVSLETLLAESDFVVVACDLNPASQHLINKETLSQMKQTSFLINASRGPIVDELALIEALQTGEILGPGLDVFEHEPLPENSPLRTMPNIILSPHNSNASALAWKRVHENSIACLVEELNRK